MLEAEPETEVNGITGQAIPGAQFMGRWSNVDGRGPGYVGLGLSGGGPDHLFWSYAAVRLEAQSVCGATFIAPNVLLSAAHCGHVGFENVMSGRFKAVLYTEASDDANQFVLSTECDTLLQNLGSGDTHLLYCDDVPRFNALVPPGELLGMADLDLDSRAAGEPVWTAWRNRECPMPPNPDTCAGLEQMVFSPGYITKINSGAIAGADGIETDQILAKGSSGSGIWRQTAGSSHRLVSSGLSHGPCKAGTAGCGGFEAASLRHVMQIASPDPGSLGVNKVLLQTLGIAGAGTPWSLQSYSGLFDTDQDGLFDVVERLDSVSGTPVGTTLWLGFESPRRNRMWSLDPSVKVLFEDLRLLASIEHQGPAGIVAMELPRVRLRPTARYRMSVMTYTTASSTPDGFAVELWDGLTKAAEIVVPTPASSQWTMHAAELSASAAAVYALRIRMLGTNLSTLVAALTLVEQGSANRFDTHSERLNWRNDTTGDRAWIVPYGESRPGAEVSWAGLVNDETNAVEDWSLRNRQLAVDSSREYRVCFRTRVFPPGAGSGLGRVVLGDGGASLPPEDGALPAPNAIYIDEMFEFAEDWKTYCTEVGRVGGGDNVLKFAQISGQPNYLIDDVQVSE